MIFMPRVHNSGLNLILQDIYLIRIRLFITHLEICNFRIRLILMLRNSWVILLLSNSLRQKKQSGYIAINKGDTLSKLAKQYGTTVEDLAKLNGIRDINKIKAGGILRLTNDVKNKYRDPVYTKRATRSTKNDIIQNKNLNKPANMQQKSSTAVTTANKNKQKTSNNMVSFKPQTVQYPFKYIKSEDTINTPRVNTKAKRATKKEEPRLMIRFFNWLKKQDDSRKAYLENERKQVQQNLRKFRSR